AYARRREAEADVAAAERAVKGITPEHYEYLRSRSPKEAYADWEKANPPPESGKYRDAAYPQNDVVEFSLDHVVSLKEITEMENFSRLSTEQQLEVLNRLDNLVAMEKSVNSARGTKSWHEWTGPEGKPPIDAKVRAEM